jgi:hypothetical protein
MTYEGRFFDPDRIHVGSEVLQRVAAFGTIRLIPASVLLVAYPRLPAVFPSASMILIITPPSLKLSYLGHQ